MVGGGLAGDVVGGFVTFIAATVLTGLLIVVLSRAVLGRRTMSRRGLGRGAAASARADRAQLADRLLLGGGRRRLSRWCRRVRRGTGWARSPASALIVSPCARRGRLARDLLRWSRRRMCWRRIPATPRSAGPCGWSGPLVAGLRHPAARRAHHRARSARHLAAVHLAGGLLGGAADPEDRSPRPARSRLSSPASWRDRRRHDHRRRSAPASPGCSTSTSGCGARRWTSSWRGRPPSRTGVPRRSWLDSPRRARRDEAREAAGASWPTPPTPRSDPSLVGRGRRWLFDPFGELFDRGRRVAPGGYVGLLVLAVLLVLA